MCHVPAGHRAGMSLTCGRGPTYRASRGVHMRCAYALTAVVKCRYTDRSSSLPWEGNDGRTAHCQEFALYQGAPCLGTGTVLQVLLENRQPLSPVRKHP